MSADQASNSGEEEKRNYFRVDDVISVVANPVNIQDRRDLFLKSLTSSKAFSLMGSPESSAKHTEEMSPVTSENKKLYEMIEEVKTKLDFIINHFILEKEGLLSPEKRLVNISASGIRFIINSQVNEGDIMEIKLLLPTYPPVAVFAYGEVKRVREIDDQTYEVALEYLNMNESVRNEIIQYTLSHQRETIRRFREAGVNE